MKYVDGVNKTHYCTHLNILWGDSLQEFDVLLRVKSCHVMGCGNVGPEDLHLLVQAVVQDKGMGYAESVRLHRMAGAVVEVSDDRVIKVHDSFFGAHFEL